MNDLVIALYQQGVVNEVFEHRIVLNFRYSKNGGTIGIHLCADAGKHGGQLAYLVEVNSAGIVSRAIGKELLVVHHGFFYGIVEFFEFEKTDHRHFVLLLLLGEGSKEK